MPKDWWVWPVTVLVCVNSLGFWLFATACALKDDRFSKSNG